jgi:type I restriction enzyme, S subunit
MNSYKLGDVCILSKGKTITRATTKDGEVPVIGGGLGPTYYHNVANRKPPVITISASGANAGFVNYWDLPIWASDCTTIVEKPNSPANIDYIYKYLQSRQEFISTKLRRGSAQPHVYPSDIADLEIQLPSLEKQHEIVAKLDIALAEIGLLQGNLLTLDDSNEELLLSFQKAASEENLRMIKIGEVCKLMTGGTPSRMRKEFFSNGTIKWLVSGDIHKGEIFDCEGRITTSAMKSANTKILPINSVMIALNGQGKTRGTVALLRTEATCNQSLVSISPVNEKELLPEFLFYNLRMRYQELRRMTGDDGNDRRGLNMALIRDIEVPLPSLENQIKIVENLRALDESTKNLKTQIALKKMRLNELRKSLLNKAFNEVQEVV